MKPFFLYFLHQVSKLEHFFQVGAELDSLSSRINSDTREDFWNSYSGPSHQVGLQAQSDHLDSCPPHWDCDWTLWLFLNKSFSYNSVCMTLCLIYYCCNQFCIPISAEIVNPWAIKHSINYILYCYYVKSLKFHLIYWYLCLKYPPARYRSITTSSWLLVLVI